MGQKMDPWINQYKRSSLSQSARLLQELLQLVAVTVLTVPTETPQKGFRAAQSATAPLPLVHNVSRQPAITR